MPKSEKAKEVHRRLTAERGDPATDAEDLAEQIVDLVSQLDAKVVRDLVSRDARRLGEKAEEARADGSVPPPSSPKGRPGRGKRRA